MKDRVRMTMSLVIRSGKPHRPYEFDVKVSLATTLNRSKGGQFIAHVKAMPGNPYDGHTLATVLPEMEAQIGVNLARIVADRGYRGDNSAPEDRLEVYISGQKRGVMDAIKRDLRRRSAIEPVIGHAKSDHRMDCCFLSGSAATPPTPCSPPPATISDASRPSSEGIRASCSRSGSWSPSPTRLSQSNLSKPTLQNSASDHFAFSTGDYAMRLGDV
jgi:hypothetical protein